MKKLLSVFIVLILLISCSKKEDTQTIKIYSTLGDFELVLYPESAPVTVSNFLKYVNVKQYDGSSFYRTVKMENQAMNNIKIEVIQGGLGFEADTLDYIPIRHESTNETGLLHLDGTISMARSDTGSATTEFFICIGNQPELDYNGDRNPDKQGFAAFGKVISGMQVVHEIHQQPDSGQFYIEPIIIDSIRLIE